MWVRAGRMAGRDAYYGTCAVATVDFRHMQNALAHDPEDLLRVALQWREAGAGVALATVVDTWGSAPRPAGSQLVCNAGGEFVGSVSGGCVEVVVIEAAAQVMASGQSQLLSFGVSDEQAWSVGLACGGRIRVFVESLADAARSDPLARLRQARAQGQAMVRVVPLDGALPQVLDPLQLPGQVSAELAAAVVAALASDRAQLLMLGDAECLVAPCNPPLRLVVVGAVHISESLCRMAVELGYRVSVIDPRAGFARPSLFPGVELINEWPQEAFARLQVDARTAIVLLTHDPKIDDPALHCVLPTAAFYIGALGSTRTHARRLQRLAEQGWTPAQLARIHGPAGLAIGARTPAEIALSVLAQATQCLRQLRS